MSNLTMTEIKRKNKEAGRFFFSPNTMKFFNSKIESRLIRERYFVTSERHSLETPRRYTIREYDEGTHRIKTVGCHMKFGARQDAIDAIKKGII